MTRFLQKDIFALPEAQPLPWTSGAEISIAFRVVLGDGAIPARVMFTGSLAKRRTENGQSET